MQTTLIYQNILCTFISTSHGIVALYVRYLVPARALFKANSEAMLFS